MHEIHLNGKNITQYITSLSWTSDKDTLGVQLNFDIAPLSSLQSSKILVENGGIVILKNGDKKIFTGVIVDIDIDGREPMKITCLDFAFYLNENQTIIQFNNHLAHNAIKKLLEKFGNVPNSIDAIPVSITKIYKGKTVSDIIRDILEIASAKNGEKYLIEMRDGTLFIFKQKDLIVTANTKYIVNPKRKLSIKNMKNVIQIVSNKENAVKVSAEASDSANIKKFGRLQMVEEIDEEDLSAAKLRANNLLKEYNRIFEENSVELIGNDDVRAGRLIKIVEPVTGMNGTYLIKSVTHTVSEGIHLMSLSLEVV